MPDAHAYHYRIHEPSPGWGIRCTEHGELGGGPGAEKLDTFLAAEEHNRAVHGIEPSPPAEGYPHYSDPHPFSMKAYLEGMQARLAAATPEERAAFGRAAEEYVDSVPGLRDLVEQGPEAKPS